MAHRRVLFLADSRGFAIERHTHAYTKQLAADNIQLECLSYPGADISKTVSNGLRGMTGQYDLIFIAAGANNLSTFKGKRKIEPKFVNFGDLVRDMCIELHTSRGRLQNRRTKVIVCKLVGLKGTPSIPETYLLSSVAWGLNLRVG